MDPLTMIAYATAAFKFAKETVEQVREYYAAGKRPASDEDDAKLRAEYDSLRKGLGAEYSGSQWELSGR